MIRAMEHPDEGAWYVQADGRVWGPYSQARMDAFVEEGRVRASTLLAPVEEGPFAPACMQAEWRHAFARGGSQPAEAVAHSPQLPGSQPATSQPATPAARPLLVFAGFRDGQEAAFEAALAIHGPHERVGRCLWLVRARLGAAGLRNVLSRRLRAGDTLLVVEAGLDQAAWFNLEQAEERRLRELWSG